MKKIIGAVSAGLILPAILLFACSRSETDVFGSIYGIVTDAKSGEPVRLAGVTLNPGGVKTTTGNDGRYEYISIDPGPYTIQVIKDGYRTESFSVTALAGVSTAVDVQLAAGVSNLFVDRTTLTFGSSDNLATFNISNTGSSELNWEIIYDCDWIESITPTQGTTNTQESTAISVRINRAKLTDSKIYSYSLVITSSGGSADITVTATGDIAQARLQVDKTEIDFGTNSSMSTLLISNPGRKDLNWQIAKDGAWIAEVSPSSGTTRINGQTSVTVKIDRTKLEAVRIYTGKLIITSDGGNAEIPLTVNGESGGGSAKDVVKNGLTGYYTFEDGTAKNTVDTYYGGSLIGNPEIITDTPNGEGKAVFFRASEKQSMSIAGNPFENQTRYSILFWIKDFRDGLIFSVMSSETYYRGYNYPQLICNNGKFEFLASSFSIGGYIPVFSYGATAIQDGRWHFLNITCSKSTNKWTIKLYIDGNLVDTMISDAYFSDPMTKLLFGGNGGMHNIGSDVIATNLKIDNIRIYDRELNVTEIKTIYNAEK
ncbi:MAG: carboxypeptidase regulatory-like domain-containing protein [Prevotellaceae bacterium]|nr:carboxypeptidase regulatory-like domain-containing protein [Prevotellaceae bacterium]